MQGAAQSGEGGVVILNGKLVTRDPSFVDVGGGYHGNVTLHGKNGYYRRKKLIFIIVILFFSIKNWLKRISYLLLFYWSYAFICSTSCP